MYLFSCRKLGWSFMEPLISKINNATHAFKQNRYILIENQILL